jgi:methionyl-tRNA synthetase
MSKTLGNVIDPNLLIDSYGADAVRYFFLREISFGADGDFSHEGFLLRFNAELANDLGNLAHRTLSMTEKWLGGKVPPLGELTEDDRALQSLAAEVVPKFDTLIGALDYKNALGTLMELAGAGNKYIDSQAPWALNRQGNVARLGTVMRLVLELCRISAVLLTPICPTKGPELLAKVAGSPSILDDQGLVKLALLDQLVVGATVAAGDPLFLRLSELPAAVQASLPNKPQAPRKSKKKKRKKAQVAKEAVTFDDFSKLDLRTGVVREACKHPQADRLLVLQVDIGEDHPRTIVAGIAGRFAPDDLVGRTVIVVANLVPAELRGVVSEGMILAAGDKKIIDLATIPSNILPGTVVR